MVAERFEELEELVAQVKLEMLVSSVGIHETMKSWDGLSIPNCKYWSKGCSLTIFSLY